MVDRNGVIMPKSWHDTMIYGPERINGRTYCVHKKDGAVWYEVARYGVYVNADDGNEIHKLNTVCATRLGTRFYLWRIRRMGL
jgi:hypothetical protein